MSEHIRSVFILFTVLLLSSLPDISQAQEAQGSAADALLQAAIADSVQRREGQEDLRFAFRSTTQVTGEDFPITYTYDPAKTGKERWNLISPSAQDGAKMREKILKSLYKSDEVPEGSDKTPLDAPDTSLLVHDIHNLIGDTAHYAREDDKEMVFAFTPRQGQAGFEAGDNEADSKEKQEKKGKPDRLSRYLSGEVTIDKAAKRFVRVRIYAKQSFKPAAVAKIKVLEISMRLAPLWDGGPLAQVEQNSHIKGKALFKKFDETSHTVNSDFKRR